MHLLSTDMLCRRNFQSMGGVRLEVRAGHTDRCSFSSANEDEESECVADGYSLSAISPDAWKIPNLFASFSSMCGSSE